MSDVGMTFNLFGKDVTAGKTLKDVGKDAEKTGKDLKTHISAGAIAAGTALGGLLAGGITSLVGGFGDLITQARQSEATSRVTAQVIKTTGGAAHMTADQVDELATAISNKTGVDDDAIKSSENMLLTFTDVRNEVGKGNDIFNQATSMVTDMSVALGQDGKNSAIQLGKALNDPIKGVSALSKVGVSFTEQQKAQIKTLVEHGDKLGAQKIILKELGREFGGAAAAASDPMQKLGVTLGNLAKGIAAELLPYIEQAAMWIGANLMPAMQRIIPVIASVAEWIGKNSNVLGPLVGIIAGVVAAIRIWMMVQAALNVVMALNPIGLVVVAIAALVAAFVIAYQKVGWFHDLVDKVWNAIKTVIGAVVAWFITTAWPKVQLFLSVLVAGFKFWWSIVSAVVGWIIGRIGGLVSWFSGTAWPVIQRVIGLVVAGFKLWWTTFSSVVGWILGKGATLLGWLGGLGGKVASAVSGLWDGLKNSFRAALNWIIDRWNSFPSFSIPGIDIGPVHYGGGRISLPHLPHLAAGGILTRPTLFLGGEGGEPEIVAPLSRAREFGFGGGGGDLHVHVTHPLGTPEQIGRAVRDALAQASRGGR